MYKMYLFAALCVFLLILIIYFEVRQRKQAKKRGERRYRLMQKVRSRQPKEGITMKDEMMRQWQIEEQNRIGPSSRRDMSYAKGPERAYI